MDYQYQETVDWGIIKREWIAKTQGYMIVIEKHEEDRFTVKISLENSELVYYSYLTAHGKLTWGSLDEAKQFAFQQIIKLKNDRTSCSS
ncbi:hypothetical protein SPFL3102_03007 [Sporomusaceae bacterium FL31]|nr:hypothetical protein SPFL3101_01037 [Sporomusaceae bacterium FL31]GCE35171.1 hypothetical protein SPFL3102_03007 [Sporomusaceae bacterium]